MIRLSTEEAKGVYELISQLSGNNPENAFAWDGEDDPNDPDVSGLAKIYCEAGRDVPDSLSCCWSDDQRQ